MRPLLFIIIALVIGAATRHFLRKFPLPYTVMLLMIGLGMGALSRFGLLEGRLDSIGNAIAWAGHIDPHFILFILLPTLIFEAAFAMDVHTFRKSATNAILLAGPGMVIAIVVTASIAMGLSKMNIGFDGWSWKLALMFGAVISATDPVAVVALLKDLGASKKLATLIEGESLLNDGTGIVFFMVIYIPLTGAALSGSPLGEFGRVVVGGTLLGIIIGGITVAWVKKVFNDALVEISVIVAAAYVTFFIAEHFLHVSGVLGLVALGLVMAGIGRTRVSPEVEHFLHEFWELAAFIANTLIFLIVGVVIAELTVFTPKDFLVLGIVYIAIHLVRAVVITALYPLMKRSGYGLDPASACVLWYGALRGAIGLALALVVAGVDDQYISPAIRNQFLFLVAGVVLLTLLINATTIKFLVNGLGLTKIPTVKALMMSNAFSELTGGTQSALELLKGDRFMSGANWNSVREYLPHPKAPNISDEEKSQLDTVSETRRRILEKEKKSYWHQFRDGLLGGVAVRRLSEGVSEILDKGGAVPLNERAYIEQLWTTPKLLSRLVPIPVVGLAARGALSNRLALSYDIARGFVVAQEEIFKLVRSLASGVEIGDESDGSQAAASAIEEEITQNRIKGLNFLKNVREAYPEIARAVETKQAIRSVLNHERDAVKHLLNEGRIEADESGRMLSSIEERMKMLNDSPPSIEYPEPVEFLREVSWLKGLEELIIRKVVDVSEERLHGPGDRLVEQGTLGDGIMVVARGTVKVTVDDQVVDMLGPGSVIGEMAVLAGGRRTATVTAETPVTCLWMSTLAIQEAMKESKELEERLWDTAGKRFAENMLGRMEPFRQWSQMRLRRWLSEGEVRLLGPGEGLRLEDRIGVLVFGEVKKNDGSVASVLAPAVLERGEFNAPEGARVVLPPASGTDR